MNYASELSFCCSTAASLSRCNNATVRFILRDNWPLSVKEQITPRLGYVEAFSLLLLSVTNIKNQRTKIKTVTLMGLLFNASQKFLLLLTSCLVKWLFFDSLSMSNNIASFDGVASRITGE
jgi:hypothetical protein